MSKRRWFNPVLFLMARSDLDDLAQQIQFLKAENQILRAKLPRRVHVTPAEKAKLLKFARPVGRTVQALVSIVSPRTIARWMIAGKSIALRVAPRKRGRPRTKEEIRELVLKIARETGWGYTRIVGELKKLGIHNWRPIRCGQS